MPHHRHLIAPEWVPFYETAAQSIIEEEQKNTYTSVITLPQPLTCTRDSITSEPGSTYTAEGTGRIHTVLNAAVRVKETLINV